MFTLLGTASALGALWWALFALKPYDITPEQLAARYAHTTATAAPAAATVQLGAPQRMTVGDTAAWVSDFLMPSFDGAVANGRIVYPADPAVLAAPRPVLLGMHAMGRSHVRFPGGHLLPDDYVERLLPWLTEAGRSASATP